ncbi:hypothetical protein F5X97DRAFT_341081 [Nemania serpens]|nr:hypothetical protein F5X97DRAFT_341081 [Nemania serpens]
MLVKIEEPTTAQTPNETLADLRELSIQCRAILRQLSADDEPTGAEAEKWTASFNVWAADMGVFHEDQQSLTSGLKSSPDVCEMVRQLLVALKRDLEKMLLRMDSEEDCPSSSESDDSSDRSSTSSYEQLQVVADDEGPLRSQSTLWTSIQTTITNLRQLALTVRRVRAAAMVKEKMVTV